MMICRPILRQSRERSIRWMLKIMSSGGVTASYCKRTVGTGINLMNYRVATTSSVGKEAMNQSSIYQRQRGTKAQKSYRDTEIIVKLRS